MLEKRIGIDLVKYKESDCLDLIDRINNLEKCKIIDDLPNKMVVDISKKYNISLERASILLIKSRTYSLLYESNILYLEDYNVILDLFYLEQEGFLDNLKKYE